MRAALLLLLGACAGAPQVEQEPSAPELGRPDLVLALVAGLGADPPGADLAERAFFDGIHPRPDARFTAAYAQSPSPFVSLGSLLTGLYPSAIPMCGLWLRQGADEPKQPWCAQIPEGRPVLPGILGLYGYQSLLVSLGARGEEHLGPHFDRAVALGEDSGGWEALTAEARSWWAGRADGPRLLVILDHLPELRMPPQGPELQQRSTSDLAAQAGAGLGVLLDALPPGPRPRWVAVGSTSGRTRPGQGGFGEAQVEPFTDQFVTDSTLHVPLAIYGPEPAVETRSVDTVVELRDLMPTLLHLAGAAPPAGAPEVDLLDPNLSADLRAYAEFGDMLALRQGEHLLVLRCFIHHATSLDPKVTDCARELPTGRSKSELNLYKVTEDPDQLRPIRGGRSDRKRRMSEEIWRLRSGPGATPPDALDAERVWALRMSPSQGYW